MRAILTFLAAVFLAAPAFAAPPTPLTGPALGAGLANGTVDSATVDFGALRYAPGQTMGFLSAQAAAQSAIAKAYGKASVRDLNAAHVCLTAPQSETLAGFDSALLSKSAEDWRTQKAAADEALSRYDTARQALIDGAPAPYPEFQSADEAAARARTAATPESKALFLHDARDQMWRRALLGSAPKAYAGDLGPVGKLLVNAHLQAEGCAVEADNAAWLDTTLDTVPWFTIDVYGKAADDAAADIVRHADTNPALQLKVLNRLGPVALAKRTDPKAFAALWDKVALANGRPQRYGTQMRCVGKVWTPRTPLEDAAQLDQRRSWVGLPPMRSYASSAQAVCGG